MNGLTRGQVIVWGLVLGLVLSVCAIYTGHRWADNAIDRPIAYGDSRGVLVETDNVRDYVAPKKKPVKAKPVQPVYAPVEPKPAKVPAKTGNWFVDALNRVRSKNGLSAVGYSASLSADSLAYSKTISKKYPCDKKTIQHSGYLGEVIACSCPAFDILQAWLDSPSHHAIIMAGNYTVIGYGQYSVGGCTYYTARVG